MARAQKEDFLHSSRFWVATADASQGRLQVPTNRADIAGFNACSLPEVSVDSAEYREGHRIYTVKQPGNPTVSAVSLSRGVTRGDSSFWRWLKAVIEGGEYREDLNIFSFHRDALPATGGGSTTRIDVRTAVPARTTQLKECYPSRHKFGSDHDATASEISIMELDIECEVPNIEEGSPPA